MRAAVLHAFGEPLRVATVPDPILGTGEVIVDVVAAGVANYAGAIFSGSRNYLLELPVIPGPGGIGRIRATGPDATRLTAGDWVYCDATIRARDDAISPDSMLLGWTAGSPASLPLHRYYHDGSFAEQMMVPTETVTALGGDLDARDAGRWCALSQLLVPYGGLLAGNLSAGETVVVNGATGGFGSAGVAVALALGAAAVVATGRNTRALTQLTERLGPRVRPAPMSGNENEDRALIHELADGPVDLVLDLLPREANVAQVTTAMLTVRRGGRVVLMGGVGRAGGADLTLPYPWLMRNDVTIRGKWMYERDAVSRLVRLVRAGHVDLSVFDVTEFPLADVNEAVDYAAASGGPLRLTVLRPDR